MGKTYKTQPDEYFLDDFSSYDLDESEIDDEIDSLLLDTTGRHRRSRLSRRSHLSRHVPEDLPDTGSKWFDLDTADPGSRHHWR